MECVETLRQTIWMLARIAFINFFATNGDVFRCADADVYLVTFHGDNRHADVVAENHCLTHSSREDDELADLILKFAALGMARRKRLIGFLNEL
jgi:hypothetical protein